MSSASLRPRASIPIEQSTDPHFQNRIKRLIAISAIALGSIWLLALTAADADAVTTGLLIGGWMAMPLLLAAGLNRPRWRYLLVAPAGMVSAGLLVVALGFEGSSIAQIGWWLMTSGVLIGGTLGGWFWYRWLPVPRLLDQPFSTGRWALIALHTGLLIVGSALVVSAEIL